MGRRLRSAAAPIPLVAVMVLAGYLLATSLAPGFLGGGVATVTTAAGLQTGRLAVSIEVQDSSGTLAPLVHGQVGVVRLGQLGFPLIFYTNQSGEAELEAAPGGYRVAVQDPRFNVSTRVNVSATILTEIDVRVNRTSYVSAFVDAQDSSGSGLIEAWDQLSVALPPTVQVGAFQNVTALGGIIQLNGTAGLGGVEFGPVVFLRPEVAYFVGIPVLDQGQEVPAHVISQAFRAGFQWLVLRPYGELNLSEAAGLDVVTYSAGYSVSSVVG